MSLPNGKYRTKAGSTLEISGKHSGIAAVEFDWLEEDNACCDCDAQAYPSPGQDGWYLVWDCDECGGGRALLYPAEAQ